jgi:hypothetical protein
VPLGYPGNFGDTKPLFFIRSLYCLDSRFRPLRGRAAATQGCPRTAAGSRRFRLSHPALFAAAGFANHPYPLTLAPNRADSRDPEFSEFNEMPKFIATVDHVEQAYGSRHRFGIYVNEYGYITDPPNRSQQFPSPAQAAAWLNWAEYLSWRNPRILSTMQYLLYDPDPLRAPEYGGFASGLFLHSGKRKATYNAYRLPIFVPDATVSRRSRVLVWGCARPAWTYGNPRVTIEFRARNHGPFRAIARVRVRNRQGYFETRIRLTTSGSMRLAWTYPAGPSAYSQPQTVYSRTAPVTVR